jgi:hypothetical protein
MPRKYSLVIRSTVSLNTRDVRFEDERMYSLPSKPQRRRLPKVFPPRSFHPVHIQHTTVGLQKGGITIVVERQKPLE